MVLVYTSRFGKEAINSEGKFQDAMDTFRRELKEDGSTECVLEYMTAAELSRYNVRLSIA